MNDFFLRAFAPARLPATVRVRRRQYVMAIERLGARLGRRPTLADVSPETLGDLETTLRAAGTSHYQIKLIKQRLIALSRHAWRLGLVAERLAVGLLVDRRRKPMPPAEPGTLRSLFTDYQRLRLVGVDADTIRDYRDMFRALYKHYGRDIRPDEQTDELAGDHFQWLLGRGLRAVSVNRHRRSWFAIWRWTEEKGYVAKAPKFRRLREDVDAPDAWTEDEARRIVDAPLSIVWPHDIAGIPAGLFYRALLLFAYWTALRRRTLLKLAPADVDLETGWVTVPGGSIKTRRGKRLRIGPDAVEALRKIWNPSRNRVFPVPFNSTTFYKHLGWIIAAAGVARSTRRSMTKMHKLRRTTATITAVRRGVAAACLLLGHSTEAMTLRYIDPSKMPGQDAAEFLTPLGAVPEAIRPCPAGSIAVAVKPLAHHPATFFADAWELLTKGYDLAAGMMARVALERLLQTWCVELNCKPGKGSSIADHAYQLKLRGVLDEATRARIVVLAKLGNKAAHGTETGRARASELVLGIRDLFQAAQGGRGGIGNGA